MELDWLLAPPVPKTMPRQRVLYHRLRDAILSGRLTPGTPLPASRSLAASLKIARNTVLFAYEQLVAEGCLLADRQGTRVAPLAVRPIATSSGSDAPAVPLQLSTRAAAALQPEPAREAAALPFAPGTPDYGAFPFCSWRTCLERAWRDAGWRQLGYAAHGGDPALREALAGHLTTVRGLAVDARQIVITSGTQAALDLCAQLLADHGDTVWAENPGYLAARVAFGLAGLRVHDVPVDGEGLAPSEGDWCGHPPRLIMITPSHQYPTGRVMSLPRRLELIERARQSGAWIIEDDYDSEFHYDGMPTACVQGLDKHARTIYIGTFGKTLYPGLRMGYMALPQELVRAFVQARSIMDGHTPQIQQLTLARFMEDGHYNSHVRAMRKLYAGRREVILESIGRHLAGIVTAPRPQGGMQVPCLLEPGWSEEDTIRRAAAAGVLLQGLSRLYAGEQRQSGWLLGYASLTAYEIEAAVLRLANALRKT